MTRLICLTGGIATGKTRVAEWLKKHDWNVICTDDIVHSLYEPGQSLPAELAKEFGKEILDSKGGVDRKALSKIVFNNPDALKKLGAMVHPKVRAEWKGKAKRAMDEKKKTVVDIPLAYETDVTKDFDKTCVVACSEAEQKRRLSERGFDDAQIVKRIAAQLPLQKKIDSADIVIWNNGPWNVTEEQLATAFKN